MTQHFDERQLEIHPIMCTDPKHFHISSLTRSSKEKFLEQTDQYTGFNNDFMLRWLFSGSVMAPHEATDPVAAQHAAQEHKDLAKAMLEIGAGGE